MGSLELSTHILKSNRHHPYNIEAVKAAMRELKIFPNGLYSRSTGGYMNSVKNGLSNIVVLNSLLGSLLALHATIFLRRPTIIMGIGRQTG